MSNVKYSINFNFCISRGIDGGWLRKKQRKQRLKFIKERKTTFQSRTEKQHFASLGCFSPIIHIQLPCGKKYAFCRKGGPDPPPPCKIHIFKFTL